jgi:hypothetical protein
MINIPHANELTSETLLMAGIGFVVGKIMQVNTLLSTSVLVIANLANHLLFALANNLAYDLDENEKKVFKLMTPQVIYTSTNAVVSIVTILAAQSLDLISKRLAGTFIFVSLAVLVARIRIISTS